MKVTIAGTIQGKRTVAGQVVDLPDGAAAQLCSQGHAEPVAEAPVARAEKRTDADGRSDGTCAGTTASGATCSNTAGESGYCWRHAESD